MKVFKKVLFIILCLILVILIMIGISYFSAKQNNETPYFLSFTSFINRGSSMLPKYKEGDLLFVKKTDNYFEGDIITFENDENVVVTHKIIAKTEEGYTTKGINNMFVDGYSVQNNDIYGKVVLKIPSVGKFLSFIIMHRYTIILSVLGLSILMFILRYGVVKHAR